VAGAVIMASAALVFAYIAVESWNDGWAARLITGLLFLTVPLVVLSAVYDYRSNRDLDTFTKRMAWLGVRLAILGALEWALAIADIFALIAVTA
jgi:prepilin signal peptidase PulO-like enzyme (type II secretory pathway)